MISWKCIDILWLYWSNWKKIKNKNEKKLNWMKKIQNKMTKNIKLNCSEKIKNIMIWEKMNEKIRKWLKKK